MEKKLTKYHYKAFGITFGSEFSIPEMVETDEEPEIVIRFGKTPSNLDDYSNSGVLFQSSSDRFLLRVENVANYCLKHQNEVIIEPSPKGEDYEIRNFLLGPVIGAIMQQRNLFALHGSALKIGDQGIILAGRSGIGKSTLTSALIYRGHQYLSDDISALGFDSKGAPFLYPGYTGIKLWQDAIKKLKINGEKRMLVRQNLQKYRIEQSSAHSNDSLPLNVIFIFQVKNTPGIEISEIKGLNKFQAIKNNIYRSNYFKDKHHKEMHFRGINRIIEKARIMKVERPQHPFQPDSLADLVLEEIRRNKAYAV